MVKNMKNYDNLKFKIESIFKELHIEYSLLNLNDDDLNYDIQINTTGKLKLLGQINCILYFNNIDCSMNLIVGNIYRIQNNENILPLYEMLNEINQMQRAGNFTISNIKDHRQIFYRCSVLCGKNFSELDKNLVDFHFRNFTSSLEILLEYLKKLRKIV